MDRQHVGPSNRFVGISFDATLMQASKYDWNALLRHPSFVILDVQIFLHWPRRSSTTEDSIADFDHHESE